MINTAIIGCGMSARTFHLPLIAANPAYCLTALVSSREQPDLAIPRYADTATMLAESNAELVIITAPNSVHYDLAAECLAAGRHVVLEKPMVNTFAEGQALIRLAAENRRLLSVFHNRRWDSDYLALKQLLADGVLGAPRLKCATAGAKTPARAQVYGTTSARTCLIRRLTSSACHKP